MKKIISFALCITAWTQTQANVDTWKQAESFFSQKLYDRAEPLYTTVQTNGPRELKARARLRAAECELLSGKVPAAMERLWKDDGPARTADEALLAVLRIHSARFFLGQRTGLIGNDFARKANKRSGKTASVSDLSADEWKEKIRQSFFQLYERRENFQAIPLTESLSLLNTTGASTEFTPNLWSFIVENWADSEPSPPDLQTDPSDKDTELAIEIATAESPKLTDPDVRKLNAFELSAALWHEIERSENATDSAREWARWRRARLSLPFAYESQAVSLRVAERLEQVADSLVHPTLQAQSRLRAAELFEFGRNYEKAVQNCRRVESLHENESTICAALISRLQSPQLELEPHQALPLAKSTARLKARNLPTLHWQLIPTSVEELASLNNRYSSEGFGYLRFPNSESLKAILARKATKSGRVAVRPPAPFDWAQVEVPLPAMPAGVYLFAVSSSDGFKTGRDRIEASLVLVTDRALAATIHTTEEGSTDLKLYPWNTPVAEKSDSGEVHIHERGDKNKRRFSVKAHEASATLTPAQSWSLDALYRDGPSTALLQQSLHYSPPATSAAQVFVEFDRQLYRPGQKLMGKITVVERDGRGWKLARKSKAVQLTVRDAHGDKWKALYLKTNASGSAAFDLILPTGRVLGAYSLEAMLVQDGETYRTWETFEVRAYRRPSVEIEVHPFAPAVFRKATSVVGRVRYYSSQPVARTALEWKLYLLPWIWWKGRGQLSQKRLVDSGTVMTDTGGQFRVPITPKAESPGDFFAMYSLELDMVAADGTLAQKQISIPVGREPRQVSLSDNHLFYSPKNVVVPLISSESPELGAKPVEFVGEIWVEKTTLNFSKSAPPSWSDFIHAPETWDPTHKLVKKIPARFSKEALLSLGTLDPGLYRLQAAVAASMPVVSGYIFVTEANGELPAGPLPTVALKEKSSYRVGETLKVVLGRKAELGKAVVELWAGTRLISSEWVDATKSNVFSFKLGPQTEGGITVRWHQAHRTQLSFAEVQASVPFSSKQLNLSLDAPAKTAPGSEVRATLSLAGAKALPEKSATLYGTVRVVDAALDALATPKEHWLQTLYPSTSGAGPWAAPNQGSYAQTLSEVPLPQPSAVNETKPPLRLVQFHWYPDPEESHARGGGIRAAKVLYDKAAPVAQNAPPANSSEIRQNFAETALYLRDLSWNAKANPTKALRVKLDDSLTRWNADGYVYNSKLQFAKAHAEVVATKGLVARLTHPRLLREKDRAWISVSVYTTPDATSKAASRFQQKRSPPTRLVAV